MSAGPSPKQILQKGDSVMSDCPDFPTDFQACISFHGHLCPGLAIGYAAVKAGIRKLNLTASPDEEIVAVVENNSCAVDAVQVLLGCTFGKGNLIFRDWGKQVFTFMDRVSGRSVRVSFSSQVPGSDRRRELHEKIACGQATDGERKLYEQLRVDAVRALIEGDPEQFFTVREVSLPMPPFAERVSTHTCDQCGELVMATRLTDRGGVLLCAACAADFVRKVPDL
jgi:formylmethanofuran dehydrogenase subunit E